MFGANEEVHSLYRFDRTGDDRFEPGMVVNFESDLFLPGRAGLSLIIDTMAFYPDGAQLLHAVPQSLQVVG